MGRLLTDGAEGMWSSPNTYCDHYCFYVALFSALEQTRCTYCSSVLLCWVPVGRLAALVAVQFYCAGFLWTDSLLLLQFSFIVLDFCGQTGCTYCSAVLLCLVLVGRLAALVAVQFYCAGFLCLGLLQAWLSSTLPPNSAVLVTPQRGGELHPYLYASVHRHCQVLWKAWVPIRLRKQYSVEALM